MFAEKPSGPKRGSGAPSTRARATRRSQPSSRQNTPGHNLNTLGNEGKMSGMRAGRGRGMGAMGPRGKRALSGARSESSRLSQIPPNGMLTILLDVGQ